MEARGCDQPPVRWLLEGDLSVRRLALTELCDEPDAGDSLRSTWVRTLLDFPAGEHPYRKWTGAHWRLISLVELGIPAGHHAAVEAAGTVLDWLAGRRHLANVTVLDGLARRCASQEGYALAVMARLGLTEDPRTRQIAAALMEWQWPDGGWNCDLRASGRRSSFHETLPAVWGLTEYGRVAGDVDAAAAGRRAAELILEHRLFRRAGTGDPIHLEWLRFHYPPYWHYDVLQALLLLGRVGMLGDDRVADGLDVVESRRLPDGRWRASRPWWRPPGSPRAPEAVDWGGSGPNRMVTLNALRVLKGAGRWP